uniref:Protein kinase domain-containing protein n=1 Tax=Mesocestoides corti TaxID=53468 RepID=A0A5K3EW18_MESCO
MIAQQVQSNSSSNDGNLSFPNEFIVNHEWKLLKRIGAGSFGELFLAVNKRTRMEAAAKLEYHRSGAPVQLKTEYELLRIHQMIKRIETLHKNCLIHRDIKPDNFAMGTAHNLNTVYIIDFGLSKFYRDPKTKEHYPFRDFRNLTGTARYCSINAHAGCEQSRRDDLESLGYVLIYFLKGHLPWQGLQADSKKEKFRKIYKTKQSVKVEALCEGLPEEFVKYLTYCKNLSYEEEPKYRYLRSLFWKIMDKNGYRYDVQYDWIAPASS